MKKKKEVFLIKNNILILKKNFNINILIVIIIEK